MEKPRQVERQAEVCDGADDPEGVRSEDDICRRACAEDKLKGDKVWEPLENSKGKRRREVKQIHSLMRASMPTSYTVHRICRSGKGAVYGGRYKKGDN